MVCIRIVRYSRPSKRHAQALCVLQTIFTSCIEEEATTALSTSNSDGFGSVLSKMLNSGVGILIRRYVNSKQILVVKFSVKKSGPECIKLIVLCLKLILRSMWLFGPPVPGKNVMLKGKLMSPRDG